MAFLNRVAANHHVNSMPASNLATIFCPNLIEVSDEKTIDRTLHRQQAGTQLIHLLITNYEEILINVPFYRLYARVTLTRC